MDTQTINKNTVEKPAGIIKFIGTILVIIVAAVGFWRTKDSGTQPELTNETNVNSSETKTSSASSSSIKTTQRFKDGTYTEIGTYRSPAGPEEFELSLTLENDVIISSSFKAKATNEISLKLQNAFKDGYSQLVVGKPIDRVKLDVVNGASLTTKGFNEALDKIRTQTKLNS